MRDLSFAGLCLAGGLLAGFLIGCDSGRITANKAALERELSAETFRREAREEREEFEWHAGLRREKPASLRRKDEAR